MASLPRNAKTEDEEYQNLLELSQNQAKLIEEQAARLQAYEEAYEGIEIPGSSAFGIEPRQLDRFTATFPGLPTLEQPLDPHRPLRICIITPDIVGPVRNGGIGTAYRYAADLLTSAGHQVTILYILGNHSENGPVEEWVKYYADRGVTFVPMPRPEIETGFGDNGRAVRFAYGAYCWLKSQEPFDLVHLTEWRGGGYFCMLAKRLGLAFQDTLFCVKCSSPSLWNRAGGSTHIDTHIELGISFMERRSVELGDVVVSGSLHLLRWMLQHGYRLNRERCHVQPNIMLGPVSPTETSNSPKTRNAHQPNDHSTSRLDRKKFPIDEIVFFGRLEPRKGIFIFCDALSRLVAQDQVPRKVVFLGKVPTNFPARDIINERAKSWPFEVEIVSHLSQLEVVDFLKQGNRLAVIASLLENSSFAIYECLLHRIPFILCRSGGSPELVDKEDHAQVLFDPHPGDLQKLLGQVLRDGALLPQPSFDNDRNNQTWLDWHAWLSQPGQIQKMSNAYPAPTDPKDPLVSVCIAHFNRPELVRQAIESVKRQSYRNFEVVLVDDGSPGEENAQFLDQLEKEFTPLGWQVIRQENQFVSAARNNAVQHARGDYILFMDDDNVAQPNELETFVRVAQRSGADILTSFANYFDSEEMPGPTTRPSRCFAPLGPSVAFGFFVNGFGDCNALIRRETFVALGGFRTEYRVGKEDHELFARAVLRGYHLEVVPEALFWYRKPKGGVKSLHYSQTAGVLRVASPFIEEVPLAYRSILLYAKSLQDKQAKRRQKRLKIMGGADSNAAVKVVWLRDFLKQFKHSLVWRAARKMKRILGGLSPHH